MQAPTTLASLTIQRHLFIFLNREELKELWLRRPGLALVMYAFIYEVCMSEPFMKHSRSVATPTSSPRINPSPPSLSTQFKDCC